MTEKIGSSTRRAALGIGGAAAVALLASQSAVESAAAEPAQPVAPVRPAGPMPRRASAFRPVLAGGPASADESAALAMRASAADMPVGKQYKTFSAAAAAAQRLASPIFAGGAKSHLLRRATFGARAGDVADLNKLGINGWLELQLTPSKLKDPEGGAAWAAFPLAGAPTKTILAKVETYGWDAMLQTTYGTLGLQVFSERQLMEITIDIFANHLHVPIPGEQWATSPGYYRNVIRKYSFGKFSSMLQAAMKHPAMLNFLNNDESRKEHVNENLGRELLELHTVGSPAATPKTTSRTAPHPVRPHRGRAGSRAAAPPTASTATTRTTITSAR